MDLHLYMEKSHIWKRSKETEQVKFSGVTGAFDSRGESTILEFPIYCAEYINKDKALTLKLIPKDKALTLKLIPINHFSPCFISI